VSFYLNQPIEDVMRTQLAMRHLKPDPVDDELLLHLVDLAIRAPSGKNKQKWEFIFLKDREKVAQVGQLNRALVRLVKPFVGDKESKMARGFLAQAERFDTTPVVCVPCVWGWPICGPLIYTSSLFGSIYPSIQNLMLAARAAGLGTTLMTVPLWNTWRLRKIIGAPWNLTPVCVLPMGWPAKSFRPNKRQPAQESFHIDGFSKGY
jgi:nitroreductase